MLHAKHTGLPREFSDWLQANVLDRGHEVEALARPLVEADIGQELYPVTCSRGRISASCDGLTLDDSEAMEHKQWNDDLATMVAAGVLPDEHWPQCQQILLVTGAEKVRFVVSDGTRERMVWMHVFPEPERWEQLAAGWEQFDEDLATYTPPPPVEKIVAEPVEMLPAPTVQVTGTLALADNFDAFERALRTFLADKLIRNPQTDQDFADLDAQIKVMKDARAQLKAAEAQMLAQVQPIDQAKRTKDMLDKLLQQNVSMAEKILSDEKERRKGEIVAGAVTALRDHVAKLNARLGQPFMPATVTAVDFGSCIKGLRSLASMEDKISSMLAAAKIAANDTADKIDVNLKALPALVGDRTGITPDLAVLVLKPAEDFAAQVSQRVAQQKAAEERRAAELAERERERIRAEEAARLEREQQARDALERQQREEAAALERRQREADESAARVQAQGAAAAPASAQAAPAPSCPPVASAAPLTTGPGNVVPMPTKAPAATATLIKLGAINERIAPLSIDAAGLAALGFQPVSTQGSAKMYAERDLPRMLDAMLQHIGAVQAKQAA